MGVMMVVMMVVMMEAMMEEMMGIMVETNLVVSYPLGGVQSYF